MLQVALRVLVSYFGINIRVAEQSWPIHARRRHHHAVYTASGRRQLIAAKTVSDRAAQELSKKSMEALRDRSVAE